MGVKVLKAQSTEIRTFQVIMVNFRCQKLLGPYFFLFKNYWYFFTTSIFQTLQKWCPIFDSSALYLYTNFLRLFWSKICLIVYPSIWNLLSKIEVKILWEGHKIWKIAHLVLTSLSYAITKWEIFSIVMVFSENLNFTIWKVHEKNQTTRSCFWGRFLFQ